MSRPLHAFICGALIGIARDPCTLQTSHQPRQPLRAPSGNAATRTTTITASPHRLPARRLPVIPTVAEQVRRPIPT